MRGFSADSAKNIPHQGLSGGARGIRTLGGARACLGGIRPEFGALFSPNKSICAGENLFAWGSALLRISPVPFVRQVDARNPVRSNMRRTLGVRISLPARAVSKSEPSHTPASCRPAPHFLQTPPPELPHPPH